MLSAFRSRNVPLTVGIIANYFGGDPNMVSYMNESLFQYPNWEMEIADHVISPYDFELLIAC